MTMRQLAGYAWVMCLLFCCTPAVVLCAANRLMDEDPTDLLTIPDGKETKTLKVSPVRLPNRRIPKDPKPTDKIRVRLIEDEESRDFEVMWRDVKKLEFFESRVLAEAETLVAAQKFDDAYPIYMFLLREYPGTLGLDESIQAFWYLSAGASFREKRYDEALGVLEELLRKNPNYKHSETSPSLMRVLGEISDRLVQRYVDKSDFRSARRLMARIASAYPDAKQEPFYDKFREQMQAAAEAKRDQAREFMGAGRFTEAYDATAEMLDIWPEVNGARELSTEMAQRYPLAVVAVEQFSKTPNMQRLDRWADQRVGRLTDRRLLELRGVGPEGGDYVCPLGECQRTEDNRSLILTVRPGGSSFQAFDILQMLLGAAQPASPQFSPGWAQLLGSARILRPGQVEATLRRPHVLPQAYLELPLNQAAKQQIGGLAIYTAAPGDAQRSRYVLPSDAPLTPGRPREIQERWYSDPERAILALQRGEVDAMDRIQPTDLAAVTALPGVSVVRYAVPTVHVLVPNPTRPWAANRTFRRAVIYGLQREAILNQGILQGTSLAGARLLSGPFPAPLSSSDRSAYAYDETIAPHAYEPLLAITLQDLAKRELDTEFRVKEQEPPKFTGLAIGHGPLELHRIACKAMAKQLTAVKLPCETREIKSDKDAQQCDFVYEELLLTEPCVDVGRIFGPAGLHPVSNPHVRLRVRLVEQATDWLALTNALKELHRTLHDDLTVLPLWQTPEHFALRKNVQGLSTSPLSLYQDIDRWRVAPRLGQTSP